MLDADWATAAIVQAAPSVHDLLEEVAYVSFGISQILTFIAQPHVCMLDHQSRMQALTQNVKRCGTLLLRRCSYSRPDGFGIDCTFQSLDVIIRLSAA
jgi:hypothetical protein